MKPVKLSIEKYNIDKALAAFDNNQFKLILGASVRAREIADQRSREMRNDPHVRYDTKPVVQAIGEISDGLFNQEELLNKIK
jgi:DNA-directed RNA polymerase subunit K/omega